ncbi:ABC transporter substrate-binding protein [Kibdelosporangium persicum]|uniref:ABC transporter substrate-binding lipoprotein YvrC n=1 Tax=Kibdelosporangium persicum TaxID=2698649 RepID=A0ABX2F688_9PSEU|nr:ABC transporter substrate-binding protein [Kibdelosporangium persicum]NRN66407.1 putative ABC transporter substrate-binding lipoprotein YvrC [Kibdelosporangium persicum]
MAPRLLTGMAGLMVGLLGTTGCAQPPAPSGDPGAAAVTVTSCGQQLSFAAPPKRVVTLDQSSTETMLALGLADHMAGTANLKTKVAPEYQADYAKVPVLSPKLLTAEQLRAATPDFVAASFKAQYTADRVGTREELAKLGLPSFISAVECPEDNQPGTTPFDLLFSDYQAFGRIFRIEDRTTALIDKQRAAVTAAAETGKKVSGKPTVLWLYSTFNGVPYVAGGTGLPTEMSRLVGGRNAFDDVAEDWPEVSWERIAERNPDVVVVGDLSERGAPGDSAAEKISMMRAHPVVSQLKAVRENKIITVPGIEMDPSVRSVNTLDLVAKGMRELGYAQ